MIDRAANVYRTSLGERVLVQQGPQQIAMTVELMSAADSRYFETGQLELPDGTYLGRLVHLSCDRPGCQCATTGAWLHSANESQLSPDERAVVEVPLW